MEDLIKQWRQKAPGVRRNVVAEIQRLSTRAHMDGDRDSMDAYGIVADLLRALEMDK